MLGKALSPFRLASAGLIVLVVALVILVTRGTDQYLEIPDNAHPLADLVQVPGAKPQNDGGGIYYVDVLLRPASLLESYVSVVRPEGSDLIPRNVITQPGISDQERTQLDLATHEGLAGGRVGRRPSSAWLSPADRSRRRPGRRRDSGLTR